MARVEDTAHHPAEGWNAQVEPGVIDQLAAVSGGAPTLAKAFLGTAICIAVAAVAVTGRRRSRR
ncbi:hypothetical protein [Mycobacterium sp. HM-7]